MREPWSKRDDEILLRGIRAGMSYAQIAREHFPERSASGVKNRHYSMCGRRHLTSNAPAQPISDDDIAYASARLLEAQLRAGQVFGRARQAWLERHEVRA